MAAPTRTLINLLFILFAFDIIRKFFFKPKDINSKNNPNFQKNNVAKNKTLKKLDIEDNDDEFVTGKKSEKLEQNEKEEELIKKSKKKKKILTIKYDKYLYEKKFNELKYDIENNYTNVYVDGIEYPVPENKKYFSKFTYIIQIGVSLLLIFTKYLKIGMPFLSDDVIKIIEDYKWLIILFNFILHFWLNKFLLTSGAFEIIYNDKILYSKLEVHTLPKKVDLEKIIKILKIKQRIEDDF